MSTCFDIVYCTQVLRQIGLAPGVTAAELEGRRAQDLRLMKDHVKQAVLLFEKDFTQRTGSRPSLGQRIPMKPLPRNLSE
mmetsp:Transcript_54900/g.126128  ORF Transcript_54900/g.126128 Transcript_54900/m.126128 type:complete len:80 (+) Transcript_54900:240-479(+)